MAKKLRIAGYCRTSDNNNPSIENQKEKIKDYVDNFFAEANLDFYEDRDKSGYTFDHRDGYQKMRSLLADGTYDVLIIENLSRISRCTSSVVNELDQLTKSGVRVISIDDNFEYTNNNEKILKTN